MAPYHPPNYQPTPMHNFNLTTFTVGDVLNALDAGLITQEQAAATVRGLLGIVEEVKP